MLIIGNALLYCSNKLNINSCYLFRSWAHCGVLIGVNKGKWIVGVNWNHENWGGEMPEAAWIDAPNHPVRVVQTTAFQDAF